MAQQKKQDPHKEYLLSRIKDLKHAHARLQLSECQMKDPDLKLAYNSQAAGVWDTKCELERALENYDEVVSKHKVYRLTLRLVKAPGIKTVFKNKK